MNYAAAITLYNPEPGFINNLSGYTKSFPLVIVNDNSKDNSGYVDLINELPNIVYLWDGKNWGLPAAFNRSLKICEERKIDYLCTLDQDSKLGEKAIFFIEKYIESHDMSETAIVAPKPIEIKGKANEDIGDDYKVVEWVICSGAFINVKLLKDKGIEYDNAYFIDRFDADLSWQIQRAGVKQIVLTNVEMPHACGDEYGHTPLRNYYIFRNRYYFNDKYYGKIPSTLRTTMQIVRHCWNLLLRQKDSWKKIKMLPLARKDYKRGIMGEIPSDTLEKVQKIVNS